MCIYVCIHIYIYIYILYTHMYVYVYIYIYIHTHTLCEGPHQWRRRSGAAPTPGSRAPSVATFTYSRYSYEEFARLTETRLARNTFNYLKIVLDILKCVNVQCILSYGALELRASRRSRCARSCLHACATCILSVYVDVDADV